MSPRRVEIPFGAGLDREVGAPRSPAGAMEDLRDCYIRKGKLTIRRGSAASLNFFDENGVAITHILGGQTLRGQRLTLVIGFQGDSGAAAFGRVYLYVMDSKGTTARRVGTWFDQRDPGNRPPPTIVTAESFGKAFFAHDQFRVKDRANTLVFDPFSGAEIETLTSDVSGDGEDDEIKFRGVVSHLDYLFGWGFATDEEERSEIVRVSKPGAPKQFDPAWFFVPGSRRDPTTACVPAGGNLLALKEAETHVIQGTGLENFGLVRIDEHFGCLDPRLAVSVKGTAFFWSSEGPRVSEGGVSQSVANRLALKEDDPPGLVAEGELDSAFAQYIPEEEIVLFVFGQRGYALSVRQNSEGWSYWDFGFEPYSAFISQGAGAATIEGDPETAAPPGHAEFVDAGPKAATPGEMILLWNNIGEDGDEVVELWVRPHAQLTTDFRMVNDDDGDGVVNGFTSNTDLAAGSTFSLASVTIGVQNSFTTNVQKIALVSDAGASGRAEVFQDHSEPTDGDVVRASIEGWLENVTDAQGVIRLEFYDASDTLLDSAETTFTGSQEDRREVSFTAPTNTDYVRALAQVEATAADGTADGFFRDLLVHVEADSGDWERNDTVPVELSEPQKHTLEGLDPAQVYQIALRHRRSIFYGSAYTSSDPDNWPREAHGLGAAGSKAPTIKTIRWERLGDDLEIVSILLDIDREMEDELLEADAAGKRTGYRIYRDLGQTGSFTMVKEATAVRDNLVTRIRDDTFAADGSDGEQKADYKVSAFIENEETAQSNEETQYLGPSAPTDPQAFKDVNTAGSWVAAWRNQVEQNDEELAGGFGVDAFVEIHTKNETQGDTSFSLDSTVSVSTAEDETQMETIGTDADGDTVKVKYRHKTVIFSVEDFSEFTDIAEVTV